MSQKSIDAAWKKDPKTWVPGCGEPVKVLYRPLEVTVGDVSVILGPETELLVNDEGWKRIHKRIEHGGFQDKEWEAGAGTTGRVNPLTENAEPPRENAPRPMTEDEALRSVQVGGHVLSHTQQAYFSVRYKDGSLRGCDGEVTVQPSKSRSYSLSEDQNDPDVVLISIDLSKLDRPLEKGVVSLRCELKFDEPYPKKEEV